MTRHFIIKKLFGSLLLAVFAFGMTPKIFLHDLFAEHTDFSLSLNKYPHTNQVDKAGFRCNCDHLVVESPFTDQADRVELSIPVFFSDLQEHFFYDYHFTSPFFYSLRGPPSVS
ncbi:MAG: hypothetical protein ABI687_00350 [Flavitalea sp.]